MADVRCPKCGKPNPEKAEVCLFCGEPLNSGDWLAGLASDWQAEDSNDPGSEEPSEGSAGEGEIPDWLARVRSHSQAETPDSDFSQTEDAGQTADDGPDWLKDLAGDSGQNEGSADDWLAGLGEETPPASPEGPSRSAGWLDDLRAAEPPGETDASDESSAAAGEDDWMKNLADWGTPDEDQPTEMPSAADVPPVIHLPGPEPENAVPDWFSQLSEPAASTPDEPTEEPGWLPQADQGPAAENEPASDADALPAWLAGAAAGQADSAGRDDLTEGDKPAAPEAGGPEAELPDWLRSATAEEAAAQETPAAEELPEWLQGQQPPAAEETPAPAQEEGFPDWFSQLAADTPEAEEPAQPEESAGADQAMPSAVAAEDLPSETAGFPPFQAENAQETPPPSEEPPAPEAGGDIPDFSSLFPAETHSDALAEDESAAAEILPDFSALFSGQAGEEAPLAEPTSPDEAEIPSPGASETEAEWPNWLNAAGAAIEQPPAEEAPADLPDWMKDFGPAGRGNAAGEDSAGAEPPEGTSPFIEEGLPGWLDGIKPIDSETAGLSVPPLIDLGEQGLSPESNAPFQVELPEWLEEPSAEAEAGETGAAEPVAAETDESLEKAELPSWVEDLRPLESVIPGEVRRDSGEALVEKAGPLAGIRGVLQAEDLSARYRKPPVYSARLHVSDRQRSQAAILEDLLGGETASKEVPAESSRAPQFILRVIIALLLVLSLLTMLLPDFRLVDVPSVYPAGLTAVYQQVENLPAGSAVLLAVDYEPSTSGEMRFAANSVIEHLMTQNARLAIVSTVPTGPVLADNLLAEVHNRRPEYVLSDQTVNLGYLPGGTTSLLEFAQNPKRATPFASDTPLSGLLAWDHPAALGLNGLQDFALVVVLTDSPETGRAWIEQVQPVLGSVPLTMVTSAQAGPMLQPYYDSGQIQGMVVGLQGGAMYEQVSGRVNLANRFWGSYQTGSLAGLLLLILGGVISGVMGFSRHKPTQKGKA